MAGFGNNGKEYVMKYAFDGTTVPSSYYFHLANSTPNVDTTLTLADLTEASNYTAVQRACSGANFPVVQDDTNDRGRVDIPDVVFTASGGTCTATYMVMCDDNATPANRIVISWWSLGGTQNVSDLQTLTVQDAYLDYNES